MNNQMTTVPTSAITPRALRKIANELIDVHAGKPSTTAEIDHASIGAIAGIREMCEATMDAVRAKHPTRVSQGGDLVLSGIPWSTVRLGEQKAGTILDIGTGIVYDLMLLPGESENLTWAQAKALVTASGGDLPSGAEMLMLEHLLGAAAFKSEAYWTIETVRFEGDSQDSIQYFSDGCFDFTEPNDQMSVRGVRRVMVDDGIGSNTSNNSSSSQPSGNSGELAPGPSLSDYPDLQAMRAALIEQVAPVTMEGIAAVLDELNGIMDADDEGDTIETLAPVIRVINGLLLIADPEKLAGAGIKTDNATVGATLGAPDSGVTAEKMAKLVSRQRHACTLLEAMGSPQHVEAAGDLRSATGDLWDAVREQLAINALPPVLDDWMTTPASLARVLIGALRDERLEEPGEYNEAVEHCIDAVIGTISAAVGADKGIEYQKKWAELTAMAPKVPVDDIADVLAQLQVLGDGASTESALGQTCTFASSIINALIPHAGAGVEA